MSKPHDLLRLACCFSVITVGVGRWVQNVVNFSSQYDKSQYHADQVIGAPDVYPDYEDEYGAWAQSHSASPSEFITVSFGEPMNMSSVVVYETFNAGAIIRISAYVNYHWETCWEAPHLAPTRITRSRKFSPPFTKSYRTYRLMLQLDCSLAGHESDDGWCEIDAIKAETALPRNTVVVRGETATLGCTSNSHYVSRLRWFKSINSGGDCDSGNKCIYDGASVTRYAPSNINTVDFSTSAPTTRNLVINQANLTDAGFYECYEFLKDGSSSSASSLLIVLASDPVCSSNLPCDGNVVESYSITFMCNLPYSNGSWAPTMRWYNNVTGEPLFGVSMTSSNNVVSTLTLTATNALNNVRISCVTNFTDMPSTQPSTALNIPDYNYTWTSPTIVVQTPLSDPTCPVHCMTANNNGNNPYEPATTGSTRAQVSESTSTRHCVTVINNSCSSCSSCSQYKSATTALSVVATVMFIIAVVFAMLYFRSQRNSDYISVQTSSAVTSHKSLSTIMSEL